MNAGAEEGGGGRRPQRQKAGARYGLLPKTTSCEWFLVSPHVFPEARVAQLCQGCHNQGPTALGQCTTRLRRVNASGQRHGSTPHTPQWRLWQPSVFSAQLSKRALISSSIHLLVSRERLTNRVGPKPRWNTRCLHEQVEEGETTLDIVGPAVYTLAISLGLCTLGATVEFDSKCKREQGKI